LGAGGIGLIARAADSAPSSFVSITPCRLFDTRPATLVGNRATPLVAGEEFLRPVWGTNGACTIPTSAMGIAYNLTVPTSINGYLTIFPSDAARPGSSSINPVAGEGVKANGGIVGLSSTGAIKLFTQSGPVDAVLDITGYFVNANSPADTIPSGKTVTGLYGVTGSYSGTVNMSVSLPAKAPVAITAANVNFAADASASTIDDDATCTGTSAAPTAPAGKVCIYPYGIGSLIASLQGFQANVLGDQAFYIAWSGSVGQTALYVTWAYTAP
jgi:hypothetical protein